MDEPITIHQLHRYQAQPGDVILLQLSKEPSQAIVENLTGQLKELFPDNRALVYGPGTSLNVIACPA